LPVQGLPCLPPSTFASYDTNYFMLWQCIIREMANFSAGLI